MWYCGVDRLKNDTRVTDWTDVVRWHKVQRRDKKKSRGAKLFTRRLGDKIDGTSIVIILIIIIIA